MYKEACRARTSRRNVLARGNQFGVYLSGASRLMVGALQDNAQWVIEVRHISGG